MLIFRGSCRLRGGEAWIRPSRKYKDMSPQHGVSNNNTLQMKMCRYQLWLIEKKSELHYVHILWFIWILIHCFLCFVLLYLLQILSKLEKHLIKNWESWTDSCRLRWCGEGDWTINCHFNNTPTRNVIHITSSCGLEVGPYVLCSLSVIRQNCLFSLIHNHFISWGYRHLGLE